MSERDQNRNDRELRELLRESHPPAADSELRRDLWPQMLERLSRIEQSVSWPRVPWFDWVLAAIAGAALLFFPGVVPALFYHF
jgi:hypothetical protein